MPYFSFVFYGVCQRSVVAWRRGTDFVCFEKRTKVKLFGGHIQLIIGMYKLNRFQHVLVRVPLKDKCDGYIFNYLVAKHLFQLERKNMIV